MRSFFYGARSSVLAILVALAACAAPANAVGIPELPDHPLTLRESVNVAIATNPALTSSWQSVVAARAGVTRARSGYFPQLNLAWDEGVASSNLVDRSGHTLEVADIGLRQSFWLRGRSETVKSNLAGLTAASQGYQATVQGLIEAVARDYYAVLASQRLLEVADARVKSAEEHLREVKARIDAGDAARSETYAAEDDIARAHLDQIDARSNLEFALAQLKNTMGLLPSIQLEVAPSRLAPEPVPSLDSALKTAFATRPDMAAARASVEQNRYNLEIAHINRGPLVEVFGAYDQSYTRWNADGATWQALMGLSWPLFDGGARKADVTTAQAARDRAQADLQSLTNRVGQEVQDALIDVERTRQRVDTTARSVAAAEARLAAAEGRYREGMAIFLEVTDALSALTNARASQVRAGYDAEMAQVRLKRVLGTLSPDTLGTT